MRSASLPLLARWYGLGENNRSTRDHTPFLPQGLPTFEDKRGWQPWETRRARGESSSATTSHSSWHQGLLMDPLQALSIPRRQGLSRRGWVLRGEARGSLVWRVLAAVGARLTKPQAVAGLLREQ